jgi:hypothetical protein
MGIDTQLAPFISSDDSGDVHGIYSYGWHSEESLRAKAIEKYGLKNWIVDDLLNYGSFYEHKYFTLNGDNFLVPANEGSLKGFPVSMWRRII